MTEYTDLELNKMIAELEGFTVCNKNTTEKLVFIKSKEFCNTDSECFESSVAYYYDLFELMVKYKVEIDYDDLECSIWRSDLIRADLLEPEGATTFKSESEIPGAIIECILKSKNII